MSSESVVVRPAATVTVAVANLRNGPSTAYGVIGQAALGTVFTLLGRNAASDWLQVCCVNNKLGWVFRNLVAVEGAIDTLPIVEVPPPCQPEPPTPTKPWRGEYFANRDLQGSPALIRGDAEINFHWGGASPGTGVPGTNFSVRWNRTADFVAGDYTFYATVDDGVRLFLDGITVIDHWRIGSVTTVQNTFRSLGPGPHTITVEYFQAEGDSTIVVWWEAASQKPVEPPPPPDTFPEWKGDYYANISLQGQPTVVRNDVQLNFQWGANAPDPRLPADNFSVRWTRRVYFEAGNYNFYATTRDGVRVYLDGWRIIDEWHDTQGNPTYTTRFDQVGAGEHTVMVEYYARAGDAYARVWWERV